MLEASFKKHVLNFKFPAGTSRGTLNEKVSYILKLKDKNNPEIFGIGEASPLKGLSIDYRDDFEKQLLNVCKILNESDEIPSSLELSNFPSIEFALETALLDLQNNGKRIIVKDEFVNGKKSIPINGLIWMDTKEKMKEQLKKKVSEGFKCIKIKIGAISFDEECQVIEAIRNDFSESDIQIRVDANGAFDVSEIKEKLDKLSKYKVHSIEQPIKVGQWQEMAKVCKDSPIPIALDEELIGVKTLSGKKLLLDLVKPHYIILKPTLLGGFQSSQEWIELAHKNKIGWWITSALESNIGLNAISQWTSSLVNDLYQGLGTGQLYTNNIPSPLEIKNGSLKYNQEIKWDLSILGDF